MGRFENIQLLLLIRFHLGRNDSFIRDGSRSSSDGLDRGGQMTGRDGSHHRGVVDDVVGGVLGHVLLDRDLGDVVDLVMDLVPDVLQDGGGVDNRGGGDGVLGVGHGLSHGNSGGGVMSVGSDYRGGHSVVSVGHVGLSHGNSGGGVVSVGGDCGGSHSVVSVGSERVLAHNLHQLRVSLGQRSSLAGSEERESNLAREYRLDREGGTFLPRTS